MPRAVFPNRTWMFVLFVAMFSSIEQIGQCQRLTGIYVDNGMGQTVPHRVSSRRETRDIARDILDMLQLPAVPARPARFRNDSMKTSGPASRYIQDVYKYTLNQDGAGQHVENEEILKDSDVVVGYAAATSDRADKEDILLHFDLSETPADIESVIGAQLRLHLGTRAGNSVVSVHALMSSRNKTSQQQQRQKRRVVRLIDSVEVSGGAEGWIELDASEALRYWLSRGDKAASLRLSIAAVENGSGGGQLLEEPFLVGYFKSGSRLQQAAVAAAVARRWKRSSGDLWYRGNVLYNQKLSPGQCLLHTLYVRFRELEFDRMIVAPEGYDAQFCAGECRFPLSDHQNATNHAIVQTLVHFLMPGRAPQACCVPTQLDPMTVIYSRDGRNHVLKRYPNMVIRGCGCH